MANSNSLDDYLVEIGALRENPREKYNQLSDKKQEKVRTEWLEWRKTFATSSQEESMDYAKRRRTEGHLAIDALNYLRKKCLYIIEVEAFIGSVFMISNNTAVTALHNFHLQSESSEDIETDLTKYKEKYPRVECIRVLSDDANAEKEKVLFSVKWIDVKLDICILERQYVSSTVIDCFFISKENPIRTHSCLVVGYNLSISGQTHTSSDPTFSTISCNIRTIQPGGEIFFYDGSAGKGLSGGCVILKDLEVIGVHIGMVIEDSSNKGEAFARTCEGVCASSLNKILQSAGVPNQIRGSSNQYNALSK